MMMRNVCPKRDQCDLHALSSMVALAIPTSGVMLLVGSCDIRDTG